jgi:hypothetical protein
MDTRKKHPKGFKKQGYVLLRLYGAPSRKVEATHPRGLFGIIIREKWSKELRLNPPFKYLPRTKYDQFTIV